MISLRARIFIVISLVVLVILGVSIFFLIRSKQSKISEENLTTTDQSDINAIQTTAIPENVKVVPASAIDAEKQGVEQLAKIFVERVSSYSSESQYQNVRDVLSFTTDEYGKKLRANINTSVTTKPVSDFSSQTVNVYSVKLVSMQNGLAIVNLQAKISEERNGVITNRNQEANVKLIKQDDKWLVETFEWIK